jgi:hypothetical protein
MRLSNLCVVPPAGGHLMAETCLGTDLNSRNKGCMTARSDHCPILKI